MSDVPDLRKLVAYAVKAPSGHNTQPWKFVLAGSTIEIIPDDARDLPVVDPQRRELFMSLGCAAENIVLAARAQGFDATVTLTAQERIRIAFTSGASVDKKWLAPIENRQSNRSVYKKQPIAVTAVSELAGTHLESGVHMRIISDQQQIAVVSNAVSVASRAQLKNKSLVHELLQWTRLTTNEVARTGDGLSYATIGLPAVMFKAVARALVVSPLQETMLKRTLASASAFALFSIDTNDKAHWIALGRSFERFALTTTLLGLAHSHFNQPFEGDTPLGVPVEYEGEACLLVRIGYAESSPRSPRRPLDDVIIASSGT
jgi:hypothetical protein